MASRIIVDCMPLKTLQLYQHSMVNSFSDNETLVDAIANRPGFFGPSPVAFLSLMTRRHSIKKEDIDEAVINDRTLIRASAFRASLFLLSSSDYAIYYRALYPMLLAVGLERLRLAGFSEATLFRLGDRLRNHGFNMPITHDEIARLLFPRVSSRPPVEVERLLVRKLCDIGVLVRASTKGWKGNNFSYALFEKWLPDVKLSSENPEIARTETVRRYLRSYGPARLEDISWWIGLSMAQVQRSVAHLRREAVRFPIEGYREEMIGLRENYEALRRPFRKTEELHLLPPWDPYTLGWSDRKRVIDKDWVPYVYDPAGNATSVILFNGKVIGLWQFRDSQINILEFHVFEPFKQLRKKVFNTTETHALALAELSNAEAVNIIERRLPPPLAKRPAGSFLWPLGRELPFGTSNRILYESPMERRTSNTFRGSYLGNKNVVTTNTQQGLASSGS